MTDLGLTSPFLGMDPYLEQHWRDVHSRLVLYSCDQMQPLLPTDLLARVEERVYLASTEGPPRSMYPDVRVAEHGRPGVTAVAVAGEITVAEPFILHVGAEPVTETFIEIREAGAGNQVVTVVEFLSPSNKIPGEGQDLYRQKQKELRQAGVSLVEVDLLRAGPRVFSVPAHRIPAHLRTPYQVVVRRGWQPDKAELYPVPLRERLPAFRIPLRPTDKDVPLNLQAIVDQTYRNGRYQFLDYQVDADPPLTGEDAAWADALLRTAGRRK